MQRNQVTQAPPQRTVLGRRTSDSSSSLAVMCVVASSFCCTGLSAVAATAAALPSPPLVAASGPCSTCAGCASGITGTGDGDGIGDAAGVAGVSLANDTCDMLVRWRVRVVDDGLGVTGPSTEAV